MADTKYDNPRTSVSAKFFRRDYIRVTPSVSLHFITLHSSPLKRDSAFKWLVKTKFSFSFLYIFPFT